MNVLVVSAGYPVPDHPTQALFVHRQIHRLQRLGVPCQVLLFRPARPAFPAWLVRRTWVRHWWSRRGWDGAADGVPVHEVFYRRTWEPGEDVVPAIGSALVRFVERTKAVQDSDVIYAQWLWTAGASALSLREKFGWPVVAVARGSEMHEWQRSRPHCRPYVEDVLRRADQVISNCDALRQQADDLAPSVASRMPVIYNGCDPDQFSPATNRDAVRQSLGLGPTDRLALFCGDLIVRKGVAEIADVWPTFSQLNPHWTLAMVGRAVDKALAARLRLLPRVRLAGQLPPDKVLQYMQAADVYLQPSRLEGLANATMEAMAAGLPVITTDVCGQPELITDGENGWLVAPEDPARLFLALQSAAANPARAAKLGAAARATIVNRFDAAAHVSRLRAILESTATATRSHPADGSAKPGCGESLAES